MKPHASRTFRRLRTRWAPSCIFRSIVSLPKQYIELEDRRPVQAHVVGFTQEILISEPYGLSFADADFYFLHCRARGANSQTHRSGAIPYQLLLTSTNNIRLSSRAARQIKQIAKVLRVGRGLDPQSFQNDMITEQAYPTRCTAGGGTIALFIYDIQHHALQAASYLCLSVSYRFSWRLERMAASGPRRARAGCDRYGCV